MSKLLTAMILMRGAIIRNVHHEHSNLLNVFTVKGNNNTPDVVF